MIGVLTGIAANFLKGGGGGGSSQQQRPQTTAQDRLATFMQMSEGAQESRASIQNRVVASRQANAQIEAILQRELELAYRDPQVAAQRIFKDIV
jgi:hypothetical protein|tara:strand:+ start:704 stop:985 length:282 start_codon:yes stop_codon:yes gene_type:complete